MRRNKALIAENQIWANGLLYINITERKYIKLRHKQLCETEKYGDISGHGVFNFKITEIQTAFCNNYSECQQGIIKV